MQSLKDGCWLTKQGNNGKQQAKIIKCKLYTMMPKSDVVM
ncbi:hypothetical protein BN426_4182 [Klebsiella pneumoniae subsp. pneumoniae ST258-K26BO]|nr:hypothetical protein CSC00_4063 [Klebsiella pneumoniae]EPS06671.1 hypothetical protein UKKV901664_32590 [Klebsiella pneumoniae subsp. pneumoniae UKKV901664]CCM84672.1 hypothetical protein BN426_4182 [Klebsiella pneumoniae subsp. pneumoniae ST258-K26BO]CCM87439.1 hypothetical protein BN427_1318 [Klebsiella pneumoniae subsp. pneumoniae ST258-K28BO]